MADKAEMLKWARILSLIGGILVVVGAVFFAAILALVSSVPFAFGDEFGAAGPAGIFGALFAAFALLFVLAGAVFGGLAIYGATRLDGPSGKTWAVVVLVVGGVSFFAGGGFGFGSAMVAAGGGLALYAHTQA